MMQRKLAVCGFVFFVCTLIGLPTRTQAVSLDKDGDLKLGVRTYVNARVGTQDTSKSVIPGVATTETFPFSASGHVRQNRAYIEAELDHDLSRLVKEGVGPFEMLHYLPFTIRDLKQHATFRGEYDGVYDFGPREYSTADQFTTGAGGNIADNPIPLGSEPCPPGVAPNGRDCQRVVDAPAARRHLRQVASNRERLFQATLEGSVGNLFVRFGRQIWSWGETDGFRLLDQINPIDSSFGGFLISLDERRVPLDMLRMEYRIGDFGPVTEMAFHAYGAIDNKVGFSPGTPAGSPWTLPNLGKPSATTLTIQNTPARTFNHIRGGGRLYWTMFDATFSAAHYYTYFDVPALQVNVQRTFPAGKDATAPDGYSAHANLTAPLVQVSGLSTTFAVEKLYSVIRSEIAYFNSEPRFTQEGLDPFIFHGIGAQGTNPITGKPGATTGGRDLGQSLNYVLGADVNQYIRFLNPNQTFFFSTQVFYKYLINAAPTKTIPGSSILSGEVLPVPQKNQFISANGASLGNVDPVFVRQDTNQILQTLFIGTSYRSGTVNPGFLFFYDWSGSFVYQPSIEYTHDPWRFSMSYSVIDAGTLKGNSGVSLLRDRDNVLFQFEYAI
ncbi:MAG: hypothetical protein HYR72_26915 [Deltaproteobacteria bacterium]|nr:hypothetical protein [Deltaproteobacteria bacterium]MBI3390354.1 hypothetical protein [Deltaproteobacteria bacterium]